MPRSFLAASVLAFVISPVILLSQSFGPVTVPATAAIFDPDGVVTASNLSKLGATPAVEALSFTAGPGRVFTFTASGKVGSFAPPPNIGPDGAGSSVNITSLGSISGFAFPVGFPLVGVFTNGAPTGPAPANYNYAGGGSQATFAPQLNQVFFIGDGLTGTGSGSQQTFFVPATATQLWLGLTDTAANGVGAPGGYGDNPGSFTVSGTLAPGPACTSVIQNAVTVKIGGALSSNLAPTSMLATFAPNGLTLADAASACGVTGFNWQQWVDTLPAPNPFNCADSAACGLTPATSITAPPRFLDPVNGGYSTNTGQTTGRYPFFYSTANLTSGCNQVGTSCTPIETDTALNFADTPSDNQLPTGSFMVFTTALVGMVPCSTPSCTGNVPGPVLYTWDWLSSFSGTAGGASRIGNFSTAPDAGSGAGGVTILSEDGVSVVTGPSISVNGAVNAGSYAANAPLAPGSIAAVFGTFPITGSASATQLPLPTSLDGLSMTFAGVPAHLFYASSGQVNMQIPWETEGLTQAAVTVTVGGQTSIPQTVAIAPFAPSIFSVNGQGTGQGAIQDPYFRLVDTTNPAPANGVVVIYCTGLGAVTNQPADGAAAPSSPLARTMTLLTVTIGGVDAPVSFSGLVPGLAGLYQVNAQVSPIPLDDYRLHYGITAEDHKAAVTVDNRFRIDIRRSAPPPMASAQLVITVYPITDGEIWGEPYEVFTVDEGRVVELETQMKE